MAIPGKFKTVLKRIVLLLLVCIYMHASSGVPVRGRDWIYYLPAGYELWHINGHEIRLNRRTEDGGQVTVLDQCVLAFGYNHDYIGIKQADSPEHARDTFDKSTIEYYIVDVNSKNVIGPMDESEFHIAVEDNKIEWDVWKRTKII